jgi:hypothetical protein
MLALRAKQRKWLGGLMTKLLISLLWSSSLWAQSFSSGDAFESITLRGELYIRCTFGQQNYVRCTDELLLPRETDYFYHPNIKGAKKVRLTAVHADGSKSKKTYDYDSKKERTKKRVNLWISTLLQSPLLEAGVNVIHYDILDKSNKSLRSGSLSVGVFKGKDRVCPLGYENSPHEEDCMGSSTLMCTRYFNRVYDQCK